MDNVLSACQNVVMQLDEISPFLLPFCFTVAVSVFILVGLYSVFTMFNEDKQPK